MINIRKLILIIPAPLAAVLIFIVSSIETVQLPDLGFEMEDKLFHALAYFIFGISISLFVPPILKNVSTKKILLTTFLIGIIYAGSDEIHQYFVPGRTCDVFDWLSDVAGIALSLTCYKLVHRIVQRILGE
jgi:VanZ family protein